MIWIIVIGALVQTMLQYLVDTSITDWLCRALKGKNLRIVGLLLGMFLGMATAYTTASLLLGAVVGIVGGAGALLFLWKKDISGEKIRYQLATNIFFRISWNVIWGGWISVFIGMAGLYASIIFMVSNGIFLVLCYFWFYPKWTREFKTHMKMKDEKQIRESIRVEVMNSARKEGVVLFTEEVDAIVEKRYNSKYREEIKALLKEQEERKREFVSRTLAG